MAEDKEEIVVKAPSEPVVSPEKKAERTIEKALEEERFGTLQISRRIGYYFGASAIVAGVVFLCLFAYVSITGQATLLTLSSGMAVLSLALWIFVGIISIICGFLLMASD